MAVGIQIKSKPLDRVRADVPLIKEPQVRVNLSVPESVRVEWKIAAAKRRMDVNEMIMQVMHEHLNT